MPPDRGIPGVGEAIGKVGVKTQLARGSSTVFHGSEYRCIEPRGSRMNGVNNFLGSSCTRLVNTFDRVGTVPTRDMGRYLADEYDVSMGGHPSCSRLNSGGQFLQYWLAPGGEMRAPYHGIRHPTRVFV